MTGVDRSVWESTEEQEEVPLCFSFSLDQLSGILLEGIGESGTSYENEI